MNPDLLIATMQYILPRKDGFSQEFYSHLFIRSREAYELFVNHRTDMQLQRNLLMATLSAVVWGIKENPEKTIKLVQALGKRHYEYGVSSDLYPIVSEVLIDTLRSFLKEAWTPMQEHDWREALQIIQGNMLQAYPPEEQ